MTKTQSMLFVFALFFVTNSNAWILGLLGRSAVTRGVVSGAARAGAAEAATGSRMSLGQASRAGASGRDLSWVEREVAKAAIKQAFSGKYANGQDLSEATCLAIEFDGRGNYLANYCNSRVDIAGFAQQDIQSNGVATVGCRGCSIQPGELLYFAPFSTIGPFVAVEYQVGGRTTESHEFSAEQFVPTPQRSSAQISLEAVALKGTWNGEHASVMLEIRNQSPISIGLVVNTRSIWSIAQATIYNNCGGTYEHWSSPYDAFSGISKEESAPTWIAPGGKILVSVKGNTLRGNSCKLSHVTIDAVAFRPGQSQGQPTPIFATIN